MCTELDRNKLYLDEIRIEKDLLHRRLNRVFLYQAGLFVVFQFGLIEPGANGFDWDWLPIWFFGIAVLFSIQSTAVISVNVYSQYWLKKQLQLVDKTHPFFVRPKTVGRLGDYSVLIIPYTLLSFWVCFAIAYFFHSP